MRVLHGLRRRIGMREHKARKAVGQCRLADPGEAADQPGMRDAAAAIGVEHRRFGVGMPEQTPWSRADAECRYRHRRRGRRYRSCRDRRRQRAARSRDRSACRRYPRSRGRPLRAARWRRSARNAPALPPPIADRHRAASGENPSASASKRSAFCAPRRLLARARPCSAGTSRMSVRSGSGLADGELLEPADHPRIDLPSTP